MADKRMEDLLIAEIRLMRKDIADLTVTVTTLKVKWGMLAIVFGFVGSLIKPVMLLMSGKS